MNLQYYSELIHRFVNNDKTCYYEWDDFISINHRNLIIDEVASFCNNAQVLYPSDGSHTYCNVHGLNKMKLLADTLLDNNLNIKEIKKIIYGNEGANM